MSYFYLKNAHWPTETNLAVMHYQTNPQITNFCIMHLNPLNEEHTVLKKHKIIVAFHIYSNFDKHCILKPDPADNFK